MIRTIKNFAHKCIAFVANIYFRRPSKKLICLGVTGTDGKTTTATMIYQALLDCGKKAALISTVGAFSSDLELDTGFHVTSPSPWQLQRILNSFVMQGVTHVVIEATSHGLDQHRLYGITFMTSALTNITHEHLDYHQTYDRYVLAKAKLFRQSSISILNSDDASFEQLQELLRKATTRIQTYDANSLPPKIKAYITQPYNQLNAYAALKTLLAINCPQEIVLKSLCQFQGVSGRYESIPNKRRLKLIIDFAHTPNSLKQVLSSLKKDTPGKLIAVHGAAGLRDKSKRPLMGHISAKLADYVVFTAEDSRSESTQSIIYQLKQGAKENLDKVLSIEDRQSAINFAINYLAQPGDTVAMLGKGHEKSINLDGHHEIPWSDTKAVANALAVKPSAI